MLDQTLAGTDLAPRPQRKDAAPERETMNHDVRLVVILIAAGFAVWGFGP